MEVFLRGDSKGFTESEFQDIVLCLNTLFSIRAGSQPLDRDLGISYERAISMPVPVAKNILSVEIIEKTKKYEPRVKVTSVSYETKKDGQLIPIVHFEKA